MIDAMVSGLLMAFQPDLLVGMLIVVPIGVIVGIIPGLGGLILLALMLPILFHLDPALGLALLMAGLAVTEQGGAVSAILINVPGIGSSTATLVDGFPMAQQGRAGEALGAAEMSSLLGGIFGAVLLMAFIPIIIPLLLAIGAPEIFFVILLGLSFIIVLSKTSLVKGLISGLLGLLFAFVGFSGLTAVGRFGFGSTYLLTGVGIIPLVMGLFAIPEVLELAAKGAAIAKLPPGSAKITGVMKGVKETFRHWRLVLRGSAIGTIVGAIPGVGATPAVWIAYGQAKQTSKHPELFGTGCIEGVIAPESANNAKEGGGLMPTLAFGIPGSPAFAIILGAFLVMGLQPGPMFLKEHLDLAFMLVSVLVVSNIIATSFCLGLARLLARITLIRGHLLAPLILIFVIIGAYAYHGEILDVCATLLFGVLGVFMTKCGYNKPATIVAFVLGGIAEKYLSISLGSYGGLFFVRPISLLVLMVIILLFSSGLIKRLLSAWRSRR
ncbi:tripartite tricarboxylate transporter permease [Chloroflexota bacterium]